MTDDADCRRCDDLDRLVVTTDPLSTSLHVVDECVGLSDRRDSENSRVGRSQSDDVVADTRQTVTEDFDSFTGTRSGDYARGRGGRNVELGNGHVIVSVRVDRDQRRRVNCGNREVEVELASEPAEVEVEAR